MGEDGTKRVATQHAHLLTSVAAAHKQNPVIKAAAVCFDSETSSLHWKSKVSNVWGQYKHVSTLWRRFSLSSKLQLFVHNG